MAFVDTIETPNEKLTIEDPSGWVTTFGDNREWAYVLRDLIVHNDRMVVEVMNEDSTDVDYQEYAKNVREWKDSFESDWADPDFFKFPIATWSTTWSILDDQLAAVKNGAALVEVGEELADSEEGKRPGTIQEPRKPPMGLLEKAMWGGLALGGIYMAIKAVETSKSGSKSKAPTMSLPRV